MSKTVIVQAQQKWEYCCETRRTETSLLTTLNDLGQQGWELVDVIYYKDVKGSMLWTAFLKRPSAAQTPGPGQQTAGSAAAAPPVQAEEKPATSQGFDLAGDEFQLKTEQPAGP